jgi:hypothetical protein
MESQEKKPYIAPEIIFEADLEVRAGSPLSDPGDDVIDLFPGDGG